MKPLTLTLFLGLISSLGFSQIGVYSPMDYYNMYTSIRNPKNGNILAWGYDDNNDYRLVEVSGNGVLKHVTSAPQYPAFPDEIGEFFLGNYAEIRTLDSGFVIYGTLFQRNEENRKIYVSAYFEFFKTEKEIPVLIVDLEDLSFAENEMIFEGLLSLIKQNYDNGITRIKLAEHLSNAMFM